MRPASRRATLLAGLMALAGIAVTSALGVWQVERLAWKRDLIDRIEQRLAAAPVSLDEALGRAAAGENIEYLRVRLAGRYVAGGDLHLYSIGREGAGYEILTPMRIAPDMAVIVNRGFVPADEVGRIGMPEAERSLVALARGPGERSWFTPENDTARNLWFWRDVPGMIAHLRTGALDGGSLVVPPFVFAAEPDGNPGWPRAGATRLEIPNNHLQYAFTWFAFAIIQAAVFGVWLRRQRSLRLAAADDRE